MEERMEKRIKGRMGGSKEGRKKVDQEEQTQVTQQSNHASSAARVRPGSRGVGGTPQAASPTQGLPPLLRVRTRGLS